MLHNNKQIIPLALTGYYMIIANFQFIMQISHT